MKKFDVLLLDADHTILDFNQAEHDAFFHVFAMHQLPVDESVYKRYHTINEALWRMVEKGEISVDELRTRRYQQFLSEQKYNVDATEIEEEFREALKEGAETIPYAKECLAKLSCVAKLYLASNGDPLTQRNRLEKAGLLPYFEKLYVSQAIGYNKPDPRFFDFILRDLKLEDKSSVLMVGDSLTSDILGGNQAGIATAWIHEQANKTVSDVQPTYQFETLVDFTEAFLAGKGHTVITDTPAETKALANSLAKKLVPGSLLILTGDLGAGKTTFTQGLAEGMHITKRVTSPTFTIMKVYHGDLPLYHIDAYRLEGIEQDLGFEELMEDDGVCVIEWPVYLNHILPQDYLQIDIKHMSEQKRQLTFLAHGDRYQKLIKELL